MFIKLKNHILNTEEIKWTHFDRYGYSSSKYNGAYYPLVTIKMTDGDVIKIKLEDDINEYIDMENFLLNSKN